MFSLCIMIRCQITVLNVSIINVPKINCLHEVRSLNGTRQVLILLQNLCNDFFHFRKKSCRTRAKTLTLIKIIAWLVISEEWDVSCL